MTQALGMAGDSRWLGIRSFAASWLPVLVVALAVCAMAGGYATATAYAAPGTTEERQTVTNWAVTADYSHSATVVAENPVFEEGTELRGRSTYFTTVTPVLDGTFAATYRDTDADSGSLSVSMNATLVARSVGEEGAVFWTERTPLAANETTLDRGETATVDFAVNASRVNDRVAAIQESLGETPGKIETAVVVAVNASAAGGGPGKSLTHSLPLSIGSTSYTVGQAESTQAAATTTQVVAVPRTYGPLWTVGGPLLLLAGVVGLAALALTHRRAALELTDVEREYLAYRDDRAEFDEWVVRARLPESVLDRERPEAESLADVVDFAIDSDVGVVEDTRTGSFFAVTPDLLLSFDPPELVDDPSPLPADAAAEFDLRGVLGLAETAGGTGEDAPTADAGDDAGGVDGSSADASEAAERAGVVEPED
jgi:hypothetical protein